MCPVLISPPPSFIAAAHTHTHTVIMFIIIYSSYVLNMQILKVSSWRGRGTGDGVVQEKLREDFRVFLEVTEPQGDTGLHLVGFLR